MRLPFHLPPKVQKFLIAFLSILVIVIALGASLSFFFVYLPGKKLLTQVDLAKVDAARLQQAVAAKNLIEVKSGIDKLKIDTHNISQGYSRFRLLSKLPYVKDYYNDGLQLLSIAQDGLETGEIVLLAVEPYQDFLGLQGAASSSAETTQDRITFLTQSVESLIPHLDTIETKIARISQSLNSIDPNRYPEDFRGIALRSTLLKAQDTVTEVHGIVKDGRPILSQISWLLGKDSPRTYLMLFQNDAELRPTGGFWTAYGLMQVDNGKLTPLVSEDIYHLDDRFSSSIPAPRPIKSYHINVPYWNLRDMNLSPDFPTSVETFLQYYNKLNPTPKVDAVVALDTQVLVDLVRVLGRIGVPGYGNFSADPDKRCDGCPQIIYQLEWISGRPRNYIETNRKGFLGPLLHSLLSNAMGAEKSKMGPLAQAALTNIHQKHILFYFMDPEIEKAATLANITGAINPAPGMDYFHLNDANMSSAKTNLFLTQKIKHEITTKDGKVEHKVSVTYTNPSRASNCNLEKGDLCLNAPKYRNWFRFYVPTGSTMIKMTGSEVEPLQYEELGKQVFEGFYGDKYPLYAQSSSKTSIQYLSSIPASPDYNLYLQKQPGTKPMEYELYVNGQLHEKFDWTADKTIHLSL